MVIDRAVSVWQWRILFFLVVAVIVAGVAVDFSCDGGIFRTCFEGRIVSLFLGRIFVKKKSAP